MQQAMVDVDNAPRDLNALTALSRAIKYRLALNLPLFQAGSDQESAWISMSEGQQAQELLNALLAHDAGQQPAVTQQAPPPQAPAQAPPQQTGAPVTPAPMMAAPGAPIAPAPMAAAPYTGQATPQAPPQMGAAQAQQPPPPPLAGAPAASAPPAFTPQYTPPQFGQPPQAPAQQTLPHMQPPPAVPPAAPMRQPVTQGDPANVGAQTPQPPGAGSVLVGLQNALANLDAKLGDIDSVLLGMARTQQVLTILMLEVGEKVLDLPKPALIKMIVQAKERGEPEKYFEEAQGKG